MREQSMVSLIETTKNAVVEFLPKVSQGDEDLAAKVSRLSCIAMELKKQVEELQDRQVLSTPAEVLEERIRVASEAAGKITEGETHCAKAVGTVSMIWEALMEDETAENIRESA